MPGLLLPLLLAFASMRAPCPDSLEVVKHRNTANLEYDQRIYFYRLAEEHCSERKLKSSCKDIPKLFSKYQTAEKEMLRASKEWKAMMDTCGSMDSTTNRIESEDSAIPPTTPKNISGPVPQIQ